MRLAGLHIRNFKGIGPRGCFVRIDKIVVLIGRNNAGKSTVLDAYEAFASLGAKLDEGFFHSGDAAPVEITGIFNHVSAEDLDVIGKVCLHTEQFGECVKVRWVWDSPGLAGRKQTYSQEANTFIDGGAGGWDSLLKSRIPQPIRIRPTDSVETTQTKIVDLLTSCVKDSLKAENEHAKAAFEKIEEAAKAIYDASRDEFDQISTQIAQNVSPIFPGTTVEVVPRSKNAINEKLVGADSFIRIGTDDDATTPLVLQGTGLQRALLWSTLAVLADNAKKAKKGAAVSAGRILLIDEPEAFLHPPTIRQARDALYEFALNSDGWQVIATTHSPIFIDVSKDHTTIVRVDPNSTIEHFLSTDTVSFDSTERDRLQMIRACNPIVNEFFFYDDIFLVEGPTERIALLHAAARLNRAVHVIDCMGKANIPLFCRILSHFNVPFVVIHDSDTPRCVRSGKHVGNGAWTQNDRIREAATKAGLGSIFVQVPHFEGEFFGESLTRGKVDRVIEELAHGEAQSEAILEMYQRIIRRDADIMTPDVAAFDTKVSIYIARAECHDDPLWQRDDVVRAATDENAARA